MCNILTLVIQTEVLETIGLKCQCRLVWLWEAAKLIEGCLATHRAALLEHV